MPSSKTPKKTLQSAGKAATPSKSADTKPVAKSKTSVVSTEPPAKFTAPKLSRKSSEVQPQKETASAAATHAGSGLETQHVSHDAIANLAHSLWLRRGHHHGSAEGDWLHAEQQLKAAAAAK